MRQLNLKLKLKERQRRCAYFFALATFLVATGRFLLSGHAPLPTWIDMHFRYHNCSVVGNDSSMRNSSLGHLIDSAAVVYRMNFAPIEGYATDVGRRTHTMCINPEKFRVHMKTNPERLKGPAARQGPRIIVVGETDDEGGYTVPCVARSPGGRCTRHDASTVARKMPPRLQAAADAMLDSVRPLTMLAGVPGDPHRHRSVPTTGLYCILVALRECRSVDVYGVGAGTINHRDVGDLEYFKDQHFRGWDARHDVEAERAVLRVLSSKFWSAMLPFRTGELRWHNPIEGAIGVNEDLFSGAPCTSGIGC
eukprot:jgi/Mesvir1/27583/Mv07327-RA.1